MMRVPTVAMAEQITAVLDRNAEASAAMTGCRWERHWVCKSRAGLANHAMANVVWEAMQHVGAPVWDDTAKDVARDIQRNLGMPPMEEPFIPALTHLVEPTAGRSDPAPGFATLSAEFNI